MPTNYKFGGKKILPIPRDYTFGGYEKTKIIAEFNLAVDQNNIYFFGTCFTSTKESHDNYEHLLFVVNDKIEGISFEINIVVTPVRIIVILTNINKILRNVRRVDGFTRFTVKLW